jgi:beta-N-acetylhexosaminidase
MRQLSLAEKVGQVFHTHTGVKDIESLAKQGGVGALQVPRPPGFSPQDLIDVVNRFQKLTKVPILMFGETESGAGALIRGATPLPCNMALGATQSEEMAYQVGRITALEYRAMGVQWPGPTVADVNIEPNNPIINTRSFGDSPLLVARLAAAMIRGLDDNRALSMANHCPGHGAAARDSHLDLGVINRTREQMDQVELVPFRAAIKAGVKAMCTAHICYPALEPTQGLPATLSSKILTDLLQNELGFQELVVSDSFAMDAIRNNFGPERAIVMAFKAGCDMLLGYPDTAELEQALIKAIESDPELQLKLNKSVRKILATKAWVGLPERQFVGPEQDLSIVGNREFQRTAQEMARKSITVIKGDSFVKALPQRGRVLFVIPQAHKLMTGEAPNEILRDLLKAAFPQASLLEISSQPAGDERTQVMDAAKSAPAVVFATFTRVQSRDPQSINIPDSQVDLIRQVTGLTPTGVICFGSPYAMSKVSSAAALICGYCDSPVSLKAGVDLLTGQFEATGKLPVKISL